MRFHFARALKILSSRQNLWGFQCRRTRVLTGVGKDIARGSRHESAGADRGRVPGAGHWMLTRHQPMSRHANNRNDEVNRSAAAEDCRNQAGVRQADISDFIRSCYSTWLGSIDAFSLNLKSVIGTELASVTRASTPFVAKHRPMRFPGAARPNTRPCCTDAHPLHEQPGVGQSSLKQSYTDSRTSVVLHWIPADTSPGRSIALYRESRPV